MPIELATFLQPAVQPIFDELFAHGKDFIVSNLFGSEEVANDTVEQWKKQLKMIQTVLLDLENNRSSSETVKTWHRNLQDVAYDMEDLLERYEIEAYEREHHQDVDDHPTSDSTIFGLPDNLVTSISDRFSNLFNPKNSVDIQCKINEIKISLKEMENLNKSLLEVDMKQQKTPERATTSLPPRKVFGRDEKKQKIIEELLKDDQSDENYIVISIVGKGGIGKTTLAQYVYNDEQHLKNHFDFKAWVCVSEEFDVKRITTTILKDVSGLSDLNDAQEKLVKVLKDKRFLIVLDDVWNDNIEDLNLLQRPFQYAAKGSRVIMTTRIENIARMMNNTIINLEGLPDDDCWCLFQQVYVDSDLGEMRDDIIKMCKGLPLAATTLGGLLKSVPKRDRKKILDNNTWREDSKVLPVLRLSYNHLPPRLRRMFAYCSVFPKDYTFLEMEVVLLWMAQGFLPGDGPEDEGRLCFSELVSRSLFEVSHSSKGQFIMHDLIHDLALSAANGLCYPIDSTNIPSDLTRTRHVFFTRNAAALVKQQLPGASKLRTFYCLEASDCIEDLEFVRGFEYVRTLCLASNNMKVLPDYVGDLKHLRFLRLGFTKIKELPKSMGKLWNLQTLWLEDCYNLPKLPNIRFLGNLRHLKVGRLPSLKEMPMGIGELTNLQTLDHFVLGDGKRIRDLKNLNHLRGKLTISGLQSILKVEDAKEAQLEKKDSLDELYLKWSAGRDDVDDNSARDVLEQLKPPSSIKKLNLNGYKGLRFPNWLRNPCFSEMVSIVLHSCEKCENLPALGQLPSLKNLTIQGMDGIKAIGAEFYGSCQNPSFPVLETLSFGSMGSWEKWVHSSAYDGALPCLKELSIESCSALKELSPHLPSLKKLKIKECEEELSVSLERLRLLEVLEVYECGSIQFTSGCSSVVQAASFELAHLTELTMKNCSGRISLPGGLLLPAVEHVSFVRCQDLGSLPRQLHNYTSLKKLTIFDCKTMEELPEEGLPINLEELTISEVVIKQQQPKLVVHCLHSLRSLEVENVPKLEDLCVPSSLCQLSIRKLNGLKTISSSSTTMSNLTSLVVENCPTLVSLLPEGLLLPAVETLSLFCCDNMERLPSQLYQYTSLKVLSIIECRKMEEIPEGVLPINLEHITIEGVNIKQRVQELGVHHFHSLRSLHLYHVVMTREDLSLPSSLSKLTISDSQNLKSISSSTIYLSNLTELRVSYCPEFESLVGNFSSLSWIEINECPKFQFSEECGLPSNLLSSLQFLRLIHTTEAVECIPSPNLRFPSSSLKQLENLKSISCSTTHVSNLTELRVSNCPEFESLVGNFTFLSELQIIECPKFQISEEGGLPSNLTYLDLVGFQNLKSISSTTDFSNLNTLCVSKCPEFESLVGTFTSLSLLQIDECPKFQFSEVEGLPSNLTSLRLKGRMNRDKPIQEWGLHLLSSLQSLTLEDTTEEVEGINMESMSNTSTFPNLQLPSSSLSQLDIIGFQNLKSIKCSSFPNLTTLNIRKCPKFNSLGGRGRPPKLRRLVVKECESIEPIQEYGPTLMKWLNLLHPSLGCVSN